MNPEIYSLTTLVCMASTNGMICKVSHSVFPFSSSAFLYNSFSLLPIVKFNVKLIHAGRLTMTALVI